MTIISLEIRARGNGTVHKELEWTSDWASDLLHHYFFSFFLSHSSTHWKCKCLLLYRVTHQLHKWCRCNCADKDAATDSETNHWVTNVHYLNSSVDLFKRYNSRSREPLNGAVDFFHRRQKILRVPLFLLLLLLSRLSRCTIAAASLTSLVFTINSCWLRWRTSPHKVLSITKDADELDSYLSGR